MKRNVYVGATFVALFGALGIGQYAAGRIASAQAAKNTIQAPRFEVDPMWPKPLPNHWILGNVIGVSVDGEDHVYIVHRTDVAPGNLAPKETYAETNSAECCKVAPPVLEFDQEGNLVRAWGGQSTDQYDWPTSNHGITVSSKGEVYIGGNGANDGHILKFTREGTFIAQFGFAYANAGSNDTWAFNKVAKVTLDEPANEGYVSDGYGNHRIAVIDLTTGKIKRYWGAYGNKPDDAPLGRYNPDAPPAQQFRNPVHCAEVSRDGFIYVCDRPNDRIQVFTKDGKFVKEQRFMPKTLGDGSVWDIAFSKDPQQKYIFLADGANEKVWVMDRQTLTPVTSFGDGGRQPGQFYAVHSIAIDSKGNLYTTETYEGKRLQRFVYKGMTSVSETQGVVWPRKSTTSQ